MTRIVVGLALVTTLAACSNSVTPTTASPDEGGTLVEIDQTGGEVRIAVPNSPDSATKTEGVDVPEDFPMPIPDGGTVVNSIVASTLGRDEYHVILSYPTDRFSGLRDMYRTWLAEEGFELDATGSTDDLVQLAGLGNRASASVMIAPQDGRLFVSLTYSE